MMNRVHLAAALLAGIVAGAQAALAQTYPSRPIRAILVDATPGANTDIVIRSASPELGQRLGQPIVIENRVGGIGMPGMEACVRSAPDGHTICVVSSTVMSFNPHTQLKIPYDPERDAKPVTQLYFVIEGLVVSAVLPAANVKELQTLAVSRPAGLNFGTPGPGSNLDIYRQWLAQRWKANIVGVPYKGFTPIVTALVSGEVDFSKMGLGNIVSQVKSGKLRMIAVNSATRLRLVPDVMTMTELGMEEYPVRAWWGVIVPAGVPDAMVSRLGGEIVKLFREPKMTEVLDFQYLEPVLGPSEAFGAFLRADRERTGRILAQFNIPRQ
jgi:tripartite-type tricarboxylate transporter receptor subunit TctC